MSAYSYKNACMIKKNKLAGRLKNYYHKAPGLNLYTGGVACEKGKENSKCISFYITCTAIFNCF